EPRTRLVDRRQPVDQAVQRKAGEIAAFFDRLEDGPVTFAEADRLPKPVRHDQDVREQDRGIEPEAADRLQADLDGELGIEAEIEKAAGAGPDRPVFRQIAAGLPHQPDRRTLAGLAAPPPPHEAVLPPSANTP